MEDDFFLKKMEGVRPLQKKNKPKKRKIISKKINKIISSKKQKNNLIIEAEEIKKTTSQYDLSFGEINKDLKRGKIKIDRRLDLHGHSVLEASEIFKKEVIKAYNNNKRCVLVITGKGSRPDKNFETESVPKLFYGKIKNSIISWINDSDLKKYILTYQNAGIEHGGEGAIFVYLRKKRV